MDKYLLMVIGIVAGILVGAFIGYIVRRRIAEKAIGSAEAEAKRILETAQKDGEAGKSRESVELTKAELKVLELLMSQPKRVFTKEQIYESAWYSDTAADDNTIRVIISRLRDKVGAEHIKTIRGLGYRFEA